MANDKHRDGSPELVLFPGERIGPAGFPVGKIYILKGHGDRYDAVGGPPPGRGEKGPGGHASGETPAGTYWTMLNTMSPATGPIQSFPGALEYVS